MITPSFLRHQAGILGHSMTEMKAPSKRTSLWYNAYYMTIVLVVYTAQLLQCVLKQTVFTGISLLPESSDSFSTIANPMCCDPVSSPRASSGCAHPVLYFRRIVNGCRQTTVARLSFNSLLVFPGVVGANPRPFIPITKIFIDFLSAWTRQPRTSCDVICPR